MDGGTKGQGAGVVKLPTCGPDWTHDLEQWLATIRLDGMQLSTKSGIYIHDRSVNHNSLGCDQLLRKFSSLYS